MSEIRKYNIFFNLFKMQKKKGWFLPVNIQKTIYIFKNYEKFMCDYTR